MRFALLGDHADGLEMARAMALTGRHEFAVYSGSPVGGEILGRWGLEPARQGDLEEVLADPAVELLIVAVPPSVRPEHLRRALQSERHVLCVHPADDSPDIAYEAAMLQADTGKLLLPLTPEGLHPGIRRLAEVVHYYSAPAPTEAVTADPAHQVPALRHPVTPSPRHPVIPSSRSQVRLLECERWSTEDVLLETDFPLQKPSLPGWDVFRVLGGEIGEILAVSGREELTAGVPLLLNGRFVRGGLFQATYLPHQAESRWRLALVGPTGRAELLFSEGWPGPSRLSYVDENGQERVEEWPAFHPWAPMVEAMEESLRLLPRSSTKRDIGATAGDTLVQRRLGWLDEVRALELDDAVRRSIARRRASTLDFQEVTEEAGFKGTMTLVGCGLLWMSVMLLILSAWVPWLGWLIAPVFAIFLVMQLLRWVMPAKDEGKA
ncbi:MAG: Gfo/Idh/MocA family oxidoreductase [Planctomycetes bacterium]|nr:Gfo/Idh/MocA family oxidoreductase [Planctomycetota bacterium]